MSEPSPAGSLGISKDRVVLVLVALVALLAGYIIGTRDSGSIDGGSEFVATETSLPTSTDTTAVVETPVVETPVAETTVIVDEQERTETAPFRFSDLPPISDSELPPEAIDTLDLIATDGPYPFSKDGSTFQNREGYLPDFPRGHYREFTVITPESNDRGARRIVAGDLGELYYTSDHYRSFSEIVN